jgi:hypothetical protein
MENNEVATQLVDNAQEPNANGVPGSLPGETKTETVARLYKVKVDGVDTEVDEQELLKGYTHSKAASKRMEEAALTRKEAEQVLKIFKDDPKQAFKLLGKDARAFAEQIINDELSDALLSPQERELRDYKAKVETYESERRTAQEEYEKEQMEADVNKQAESIQGEIITVLESSGLPKTERTVGRIIYYMQTALAAGYNVTPSDVIDQVKADYKFDLNAMLGGLPEEALEAFLGKDLISRVAKSTVKTAAVAKTNVVDKSVNANKGDKLTAHQKKYISPREFFKSNR